MSRENTTYDKDVIVQMTQVVLTEILEQVLVEFEQRTGTRIGRIRITDPHRSSGRRHSEIEVRYAGRNCLSGLMAYKQILCEHDMFRESSFCRMDEEDLSSLR